MEFKIKVVGIGPGSRDYILPIALRYIEQAKVLIGGKRALAEYSKPEQETFPILNNIIEVMQFIKLKLVTTDVVVMVSGDTGFHSLLTRLRQEFTVEQLEVIPGICSLQLAFARAADYWQDAKFISLHGESFAPEKISLALYKKIAMLTDHKNTPAKIASYFLENGWPSNSEAVICSNLSYSDEIVAKMSLREMLQASEYKNCVVIVCARK